MGFVVFFLLAWLTGSLVAVIKKKLTLAENTLVFLVVLIVSINFSWIVIEELRLIKLTKSTLEYTGFLLNRSVITPFLVLIQLNLLLWSKTMMMKITIIVAVVILLIGVSSLSNFYDIIDYKHWNYWYDGIYFFILNLIAIFSYKLYARVSRNVVSY
ncbi:hypothetical protein [Bacillus sp. UNC41MFS5]|uniref:hypothetical protein n=1 Tax=Bacillus sp. UNC41MFS5 TaxID=1449046 RepID=UPI00047B2DAF|nr:hypothetical protein [Bacillus sp. UNC41MFS5]